MWESLMSSHPVVSQPTNVDWGQLTEFARSLPAQLAAAYALELKEVRPSHAGQQEEAVDRLIGIIVTMWTSLARAYPANHFMADNLETFFRNYLANRQAWRSLLVYGEYPDPLQALEVKLEVLTDAEDAVADTVSAIFRGNDRVMLNLWTDWWNEARAMRDGQSQ
jgi:hypothetical protein